MANSSGFDWLAEALEEATSLDRLEARGTLRIALKNAGLDAASASVKELKVVLEKVMPAELEARGISHAAKACADLARGIEAVADDDSRAESPADVFARLG